MIPLEQGLRINQKKSSVCCVLQHSILAISGCSNGKLDNALGGKGNKHTFFLINAEIQ